MTHDVLRFGVGNGVIAIVRVPWVSHALVRSSALRRPGAVVETRAFVDTRAVIETSAVIETRAVVETHFDDVGGSFGC